MYFVILNNRYRCKLIYPVREGYTRFARGGGRLGQKILLKLNLLPVLTSYFLANFFIFFNIFSIYAGIHPKNKL